MIGFGWVRTHLRDGFLESIQLCLWFLVGFLEKMKKSSKIWARLGVLHHGDGSAKSFVAAKHCFVVARPSGKNGPASGSPRRSHCSQHGNVVFLFHFVFPLFQRLVYWTNKDPISI